ncbi:MAG: aminomethyl-transferring glycine dehydrogenase [Acidimicrobiales bacterium]
MPAPQSDRFAVERFADRHIGADRAELQRMVEACGYPTVDALIDGVVPESIRNRDLLDLPAALTEVEALARIRSYADRNQPLVSMIGQGYYDTVTPPCILRNVLENPGWYTAYTPYQPEISQGRLEAIINFQTMVADLCALDIANASMLDEGTAAAEAMTMARRATKTTAEAFFVDVDCHPQTIAVVETRAEPLGIKVLIGDPATDLDASTVFGALLAYPGSSGSIVDHRPVIAALHEAGALAVVASDLLALCVLEAPGTLGADIAVGSAQRFGVPMGFGGPHAGFLACTDAHKRSLPGRLVGYSVDAAGRPGLRLALQTREQHIRREKATSNICTAQVLLAVMASMYAVYHGPDGLRRIANRTHAFTSLLAEGLTAAGVTVVNDTWFDTLTVAVPGRAAEVVAAALAAGINIRPVDADHVGISCDEATTAAVVDTLLGCFSPSSPGSAAGGAAAGIPAGLGRTTDFCTHPVFRTHHSETEMMRYLRTLADRDIALDRAMIPLGSCTMKLNAATEMIPVTWPEFGRIHPFAPLDQAQGYLDLFADLEQWLATITGYDAVSLQPNAGSQGEYAGLMAIRAYHHANGDIDRDVCLIPSSAHGTNAASAVMVGMRVVVVASGPDGSVDLDDLRAKIETHGTQLAALMITYPSTHGVFEEAIGEICELVHAAGGQVYLDGANMNALVGLAQPGAFGSDVSHLNLHKTFCIPHGGGGPGVGPIGVRSHLEPYLPNRGVGSIASAPWGSASILPIPWSYIAMMGPDGLRDATTSAIVAANYIATRLGEHYPVLYSGRNGLVAHECIVDIRPIEKECGVSGEDIAKRLVDYGFHAPTMSFPVPGTLMIEPTESEPLVEIDRFCDAMIAIRAEIERVASGEWALEASPLRNAPHPAEDLLVDEWPHPYTRAEAAYPVASLRTNKYWPPVSRIDNGYGDRNLICACPPVEAFAAD